MSTFLHRRGGAALVAAASGLAMALSGAIASPASAASAPHTSILSLVASTGQSSDLTAAPWFRDPRTPAQRKAQIRIPGSPAKYRGIKRETRAVYRTRDGSLAVPASFAVGHQLSKGHAVTLDRAGTFRPGTAVPTASGNKQFVQLARSLDDATRLRCEGYADYSSSRSTAAKRAKSRAAQVCARLKSAAKQSTLRTKSVSYGSTRPAVVGGPARNRRMNYRVVVTVTEAKAVQPTQPPSVTVPDAPRLDYVEGIREGVAYGFAAPGKDGHSPVTGYEVTTGSGWSPVELARDKSGNGLIHAEISRLSPGTEVALQVRALNAAGAGPASATVGATAFGVPTAPTGLTVTGGDGRITTTFGPSESDGGAPITSYAISYDGAATWTTAATSGDAPWTVIGTGFKNGTTYDVHVRSSSRAGSGPAASQEVLVATVPGAPTDLVATARDTSVTLKFTAPASSGGSPITGYEVKVDAGSWVAATVTNGAITLTNQARGTHVYAVRAVNALGASAGESSGDVDVPGPSPQTYRSEYHYSGEQLWTYVFFTTVPGAVSYEARLDGGQWLTVAVEADWITERMGRVMDPVCGATTCTSERTIEVRAVFRDGYSGPGNSFPVTYFAG